MPPGSKKKSADNSLVTDLRRTIEFFQRAQKELRDRQLEMREMHQKMHNALVRYRNLFESAPVGYVIVNAASRILECNRVAAAMLGRPSVLQGQHFLNFVPTPHRRRFQEYLAACWVGKMSGSFEIDLFRGFPDTFPAQIALAKADSVGTALRDIRITIVDLTELKMAQAALEKAKSHVERQVEKRTRELRRSNERLAEEVALRTRVERQLLEITERERRRFGQDLHDETCQSLTGLALEFSALSGRMKKDGVKMAPRFQHLAESLNTLVENSRAIARGLHPVCLGGGLLAALEELTNDVSRKVPCIFDGSLPGVTLPSEVELALYRIVQEALNNAVKHAHATRARVRLRRNLRSLSLVIEDDGVGLPEKAMEGTKGMGLNILQYRARSIGAELRVENLPRKGVKVACELPFSVLPGGAVAVPNKNASEPAAARPRSRSSLRTKKR
jgi:PAS domain S-box-containing protein